MLNEDSKSVSYYKVLKAHTAFGRGPTTTKKCGAEGTYILLGA